MILVRAAAITDNDATVASDRGAGKPLTKFKGLGAWDGFRRGMGPTANFRAGSNSNGCLESLAHRTAPHQGQQWGQPTGGVLLSGGLARDSPGGQRVWPQLSSSRCQGAALGGRDRRDQPVPYPARLWCSVMQYVCVLLLTSSRQAVIGSQLCFSTPALRSGSTVPKSFACYGNRAEPPTQPRRGGYASYEPSAAWAAGCSWLLHNTSRILRLILRPVILRWIFWGVHTRATGLHIQDPRWVTTR
ncbi:hypothetical protein VTN96DRAFT_8540 [Rasamsonia emersonii]